jgi:hypothetical protein
MRGRYRGGKERVRAKERKGCKVGDREGGGYTMRGRRV